MSNMVSRRDQWLARAGLAGIVILAALMNVHTLTDVDIFWQLKTGQIIWETHRVPHTDLFSFTRAGQEWIDAQWLFQVIIYGLYRVWGYAGMILFGAFISGLTWVIILKPSFHPRKYLPLLALALLSLQTASPRLKLRPELLTFFYLALELFLIHQYRRGKKTALYFLPALLLLWVNSEGLWPIYFVVLTTFLLEETIFALNLPITGKVKRVSPDPARGSVARLLAVLAASLALALINPYGYRGAIFPVQLFTEISSSQNLIRQSILEFRSPFSRDLPWFDRAPYIALLVFSALMVAAMLLRRQAHLMALMLWAVFLYLSLSAARNMALFALICAGPLASAWAASGDREILRFPALQKRLAGFRPVAALVMLLLMVLIALDLASSRFFIQNRSFSRFGIGALETDYPIRAADTLKRVCAAAAEPVHLKIFSDYNSGYLIWAGYPQWKVYVDPRLEVYGEEMMKNFFRASTDEEEFKAQDRKYDFDAVVLTLEPQVKDLVARLYRDPNWVLVHLDGFCVVLVKNRPGFAPGLGEYRLDLKPGLASPLPRSLGGLWLVRERLNRGSTLLSLGYPEPAWLELKAGLELEPENMQLNFFAGLALNMMRRYQEAIPYLDRVAAHNPDDIPDRNEQAWAYFAVGRAEDAIAIYRQVLERHPKEITTCMNLALAYENSRSGLAYPQWQSCRQIYESDPQAYQGFYPGIEQGLLRTRR